MRDVMDGARDSWWIVLVVPLKMAWRSIWRMVIFATAPDVFEVMKEDYEREHALRMADYEREHALRMAAEAENANLRRQLAGSGDSPSNKPNSTIATD